jgi:hypothetical protein
MAMQRGTETLYLHVDVSNHGALKLYEKAGYHRLPETSIFREFTTSLNLHPGATKGRDHFLLCKNLAPEPTWLEEEDDTSFVPARGELIGTLGFEIPA